MHVKLTVDRVQHNKCKKKTNSIYVNETFVMPARFIKHYVQYNKTIDIIIIIVGFKKKKKYTIETTLLHK